MRVAIALAVALTLVSVATADPAEASIRKQTLIPAQNLGSALKSFATERGLAMIYRAELVDDLTTGGATGELSVDEALRALLSGTELTYKLLDEKTVTIVPVGPAVEKVNSATAGAYWKRVRMAQTDSAVASASDERAVEASPALSEVVVTAQKREERLQDVPISISVLSGEELDRSTVRSVTDALSRVPGVVIDEGFQSGGTQVTVRGVTAASGFSFGSSPIGYYLDSVPFSLIRTAIAPDPAVFDLDRVEVLRGPQGTLYGAGGAGGVVRVLTKDARLDKFELKARTDFSATEHGGENSRADVAMNVPLIDGKLAVRAVLGYQSLSGWIDRRARDDANDGRLRNARFKLNAQPTDALSIGLSAWVSRNNFGAMSTSANNRTNPNDDVEPTSNDFETYGLNIGYDFSGFSLTSMTSYLEYDNNGYLDFTRSFGVPGRILRTNPQAKTFAQEVNLASTGEGPWRWTLGGIYRDGQDRTVQSYNTGFVYPTDMILYTSESWAAFGELTRTFLEGKLEVTAGIRHFEDDAGMQEELRRGQVLLTDYISTQRTFDATTPRFVLTWHPADQQTVYASYSEGFRSGLDQAPVIVRVAPVIPPAMPDLLKNYEVGTKGSLWNGRVGYDAAVYYIDWQDVQLPINIIVEGVGRAALINGASASGMGVDLGLTTRPAKGLELGVNVSWNNLETDSDVLSGGIILFNKGDRLNHSPEYTAGVMASYDFPLGKNGFTGRFSTSANVTAERTYRSLQGPLLVVRTGDELLVSRAAFSIESPDRWSTTLFVDNINSEDGAVARQPFTAFTGEGFGFEDWDTRLRPRTFGVQFDYRY